MPDKNQKLFLTLILFAVIFANFAFCLSPVSAQVSTPEPAWTGIVPCGRNSGTAEEMAPCTLCHLIVGFQRLVQYGMYMVVTLALVGIFFAGVMYMVSTGDENMMTQAKGFLKVSLIGFSVVIGGWLIVNVTMWVLGAKTDLGVNAVAWNKFTCDTKSSQGKGATTTSTPSVSAPTGTYTPSSDTASTTDQSSTQNPPTPTPTPTPEPEPTPEPSDSGNVDLQVVSFKSPGAGDNSCSTAEAVIKNAGSDPAGSFAVTLIISKTVMASPTVSGLAGGASTTVALKYCNARQAGAVHTYYKIYVVVDPGNTVKETNEGNNESPKRDFEIL